RSTRHTLLPVVGRQQDYAARLSPALRHGTAARQDDCGSEHDSHACEPASPCAAFPKSAIQRLFGLHEVGPSRAIRLQGGDQHGFRCVTNPNIDKKCVVPCEVTDQGGTVSTSPAEF